MDQGSSARCLLCRFDAPGGSSGAGPGRLLAIELERVVETMRPLPIEAFPGTAAWVLGVALIRDEVVPIVDVGALLGVPGARIGRFVTIVLGPRGSEASRTVALAVSDVVGVEVFSAAALIDRPPLLGSVAPEALSAIGTLDGELLLALGGARLVPDTVWASLDEQVRTF